MGRAGGGGRWAEQGRERPPGRGEGKGEPLWLRPSGVQRGGRGHCGKRVYAVNNAESTNND